MTRIITSNHQPAPLRTARPGEFRPLTAGRAQRLAQERAGAAQPPMRGMAAVGVGTEGRHGYGRGR